MPPLFQFSPKRMSSLKCANSGAKFPRATRPAVCTIFCACFSFSLIIKLPHNFFNNLGVRRKTSFCFTSLLCKLAPSGFSWFRHSATLLHFVSQRAPRATTIPNALAISVIAGFVSLVIIGCDYLVIAEVDFFVIVGLDPTISSVVSLSGLTR